MKTRPALALAAAPPPRIPVAVLPPAAGLKPASKLDLARPKPPPPQGFEFLKFGK